MHVHAVSAALVEPALRLSKALFAQPLVLLQGLMDGFLKVLDRNLGQAQPSKPPDASLYQMKSAPLSSSEAVCCQGRRAGLPGGGGGRGTPAQVLVPL